MNFLVVQDDDEGRQSESSADNVEDEDEEDTSGNDEDQSEYESFEVVLQIHKNIFFWLGGGLSSDSNNLVVVFVFVSNAFFQILIDDFDWEKYFIIFNVD